MELQLFFLPLFRGVLLLLLLAVLTFVSAFWALVIHTLQALPVKGVYAIAVSVL